ncbi:MAG: DUF885 domain-containing protein [Bacteroidetes bacterium]|nr:DUF885 domain-containing protein [Bacteroidota bacterium]
MKNIYLVLILPLITFLSCMVSPEKNATGVVPDSLFHHFWEEYLAIHPLEATQLGDPRYNHILDNNISAEYFKRKKEFLLKYKTQIAEMDQSVLSNQDQMSVELLAYIIDTDLTGIDLGITGGVTHASRPINQFDGYHITFGTLGSGASYQPFETVLDYENFVGRMDGFVDWSQTAIENMRKSMDQGDVIPKACVVKVLPQLQSMLVDNVEESIFYGPIQNLPEHFEAADQSRLTEDYRQAIENKIIPAYQNLYQFIKDDYLPSTRESAGIYDVPRGKEIYEYMVSYWTTTDMTADEIFDLGQKEVTRIKGEMEQVKQQVGFEGNLQEFFQFIYADPRFFPFKQDQEVIDAFKEIEGRMESKLTDYFNLVPQAPFEVRQTEEFREASGSAEYMQGSADGSRPGIFYVPVIDPTQYNNFQMEDLFLHEAIPGHHYQISIQQELVDIPQFRRFLWNGAYVEGWALYAESLGKELGLYEDPYQYFGKLGAEMHRAIRLVVDVGMHVKGWTREQAIQYSLENEAISEDEAIAEIERYMVWPGQALSYKIGELKILELREKAQKALGNQFDIGLFHDEILKDGALPLKLLEKKINTWIEQKKGQSS